MFGSGSVYRHTVGIIMLMAVVVLWVSSSVITQKIFLTESFDAPFFLTYFNTAVFITYLIPILTKNICARTRSNGDAAVYSEVGQSDGDQPPTAVLEHWFENWKVIFKQSVVFCPVWFTMNFLFNWSLDKTSVATNTIMSSTSSMFTLAFSACFLKTPLTLYNGLGALFAIVGAVLVVLPDWEDKGQHSTLFGDALALVSASVYAIYSTLLKYRISEEDESKISMPLFFGLIGLTNVVVLAPIIVIFHFTGIESLSGFSVEVFFSLLVNGIISMLSDLLWAKSVLFTSPLVASIALSLTIPLSEVADVLFNGRTFQLVYLIGSLLVFAGFVLANLQFSKDRKIAEIDSSPEATDPQAIMSASSDDVELYSPAREIS